MPWAGRKRLPECDALLYHAYSLYKAGVHDQCGVPRSEGFDDANEGAYEVVDDEETCHACAAWERWRKDSTDKDRRPGMVPYLRHVKDGHGGVSQADLLAGYSKG